MVTDTSNDVNVQPQAPIQLFPKQLVHQKHLAILYTKVCFGLKVSILVDIWEVSRERLLGGQEAKVASRHSTWLVSPNLLYAFKARFPLHMQIENVLQEGRSTSLGFGQQAKLHSISLNSQRHKCLVDINA